MIPSLDGASHEISSVETRYLRRLAPVWFLMCLVVLVFTVSPSGVRDSQGAPLPSSPVWPGALALIGSAVAYGWLCWWLKRVDLDERALRVRGLASTAVIPLELIATIRDVTWFLPETVTIRFTTRTPFGRSITFMPARRTLPLLRQHPVVAELFTARDRAVAAGLISRTTTGG